MKPAIAWVALSSLAIVTPLPAVDRPAPAVTAIADGVWLFQTASYGDAGLDGNSIAIVTSDGVVMFDANGTPAASAAVLAELRKRTPQPVRDVIYSHWHWDHWYGTETYAKAFPGLHVIAHEKARELMIGPALEFNKPGLERDLPGYITSLANAIAEAEKRTPPPASLPAFRDRLDQARFFLDQKAHASLVFPDVTYSDRLTLVRGGRRIEVRHPGRAVTPGDSYVYLPDERILITGDLLINPISFALSCYPSEWIRALEQLDALDAVVIVPGHGDPLKDKRLLRSTTALFRELLKQGREAKAKGLDPDAARDAIWPSLAGLEREILGDRTALEGAFKIQLVDWFLHRVYDELDGKLTDAIAPIPAK